MNMPSLPPSILGPEPQDPSRPSRIEPARTSVRDEALSLSHYIGTIVARRVLVVLVADLARLEPLEGGHVHPVKVYKTQPPALDEQLLETRDIGLREEPVAPHPQAARPVRSHRLRGRAAVRVEGGFGPGAA